MIDRLPRAALLACALAIALTAAAVAAKPVGFPTYKQCISKTRCLSNGYSDVKGRTLNLNFISAKCTEFGNGLLTAGTLGAVHPKPGSGRFSLTKSLQGISQKDQKYYPVMVKITGVQHFKKSIVGSYTATTTAPDCPASAQKPVKFKMKFAGLAYGG